MGGTSIKKRKEALTMEMGLPLGKKEGLWLRRGELGRLIQGFRDQSSSEGSFSREIN